MIHDENFTCSHLENSCGQHTIEWWIVCHVIPVSWFHGGVMSKSPPFLRRLFHRRNNAEWISVEKSTLFYISKNRLTLIFLEILTDNRHIFTKFQIQWKLNDVFPISFVNIVNLWKWYIFIFIISNSFIRSVQIWSFISFQRRILIYSVVIVELYFYSFVKRWWTEGSRDNF